MTTVLLAINSSIWQATPGPFKGSSAKQNVLTYQTFDFMRGMALFTVVSDARTCSSGNRAPGSTRTELGGWRDEAPERKAHDDGGACFSSGLPPVWLSGRRERRFGRRWLQHLRRTARGSPRNTLNPAWVGTLEQGSDAATCIRVTSVRHGAECVRQAVKLACSWEYRRRRCCSLPRKANI